MLLEIYEILILIAKLFELLSAPLWIHLFYHEHLQTKFCVDFFFFLFKALWASGQSGTYGSHHSACPKCLKKWKLIMTIPCITIFEICIPIGFFSWNLMTVGQWSMILSGKYQWTSFLLRNNSANIVLKAWYCWMSKDSHVAHPQDIPIVEIIHNIPRFIDFCSKSCYISSKRDPLANWKHALRDEHSLPSQIVSLYSRQSDDLC